MRHRLPQYKPGDHLAVCDRCGFTLLASEMKKTWDGLFVCPEDWEPRHPQDFVRSKSDRQSVSNPRPYPETVYATSLGSAAERSAIAGHAVGGFSIAGLKPTLE